MGYIPQSGFVIRTDFHGSVALGLLHACTSGVISCLTAASLCRRFCYALHG